MQIIGSRLLYSGSAVLRASSRVQLAKPRLHTRFCTTNCKSTNEQTAHVLKKRLRGFTAAASLLLMGCCLPIGALLLPGKDEGGAHQNRAS